jgi:hypothetical protein
VIVMGMTGSGKSTFISLLADEMVQVGHDLSSCKCFMIQNCRIFLKCCSGTIDAQGYIATIDGHPTLLLDTPGFDDTERSDFEIVNEIAMGLHVLYEKRLSLRGVIYIQRIADTRMSGSSRRTLEILDAICGIPASANITFVTTMWDKLGPNSETIGRERTEEMERLFLAKFIERGARIERHAGTAASAKGIITRILSIHAPIILEIQHETEVQNLALEQTRVGKILCIDLQRQQKEFDAELEETEQQLLEAHQSNDRMAIEMLSEEIAHQKEQIVRLETSRTQLRYGVQQLGEMKNISMQRELEEAQKLDIEIGQGVNDDIKDQIRRTAQRTRSLQDDQEWERNKFYDERARMQSRGNPRNRERLTVQKARRRAEREKIRRESSRVALSIWDLLVSDVFEYQWRSRGY